MTETSTESIQDGGPGDSQPTAEATLLVDTLGALDTAGGTPLLSRLAPAPGTRLRVWRHYLGPGALAGGLAFGLPTILAAVTLPTFAPHQIGLIVPYAQDWNILFMCLVSFPAILILLLTERALIPACLASIAREGVLRAEPETAARLRSTWERRYRKANVIGAAIGLVLAITVSLFNYSACMEPDVGLWAVTDGHMHLSGWLLILWQLPLFYFVGALYLARAVTTIAMLASVVRESKLALNPFHEDGCGGLKMVGRLGLRNQYFLLVAGINVVLLFYVLSQVDAGVTLVGLLVAAAVGYLLSGPIFFMGPLLPFRAGMRKIKVDEERKVATRLQEEYEGIMGTVQQSGISSDAKSSLDALLELRAYVRKLPVWPFDLSTLKKFLTAYAFPLLLFLASTVIGTVIEWVTNAAI